MYISANLSSRGFGVELDAVENGVLMLIRHNSVLQPRFSDGAFAFEDV